MEQSINHEAREHTRRVAELTELYVGAILAGGGNPAVPQLIITQAAAVAEAVVTKTERARRG